MSHEEPKAEMIPVGNGESRREIAVRHRAAQPENNAPGFIWLGGYRSDMAGTKAIALDELAAEEGCACTRFDYSGHGESGGKFTDGTISRWLEESLHVFGKVTQGAQVLVGSSMGGWIALRMVEELRKQDQGQHIAGLLLLAPAPDFTEDLHMPKLTEQQKADLDRQGFYEEETPYGPDPNVFTKALFDDGKLNRVLKGTISVGAPVHILQGMEDPDVPYEHAFKLLDHLPADDVVLTLIRDGDHRLSRPQDIARLLQAAKDLIAS